MLLWTVEKPLYNKLWRGKFYNLEQWKNKSSKWKLFREMKTVLFGLRKIILLWTLSLEGMDIPNPKSYQNIILVVSNGTAASDGWKLTVFNRNSLIHKVFHYLVSAVNFNTKHTLMFTARERTKARDKTHNKVFEIFSLLPYDPIWSISFTPPLLNPSIFFALPFHLPFAKWIHVATWMNWQFKSQKSLTLVRTRKIRKMAICNSKLLKWTRGKITLNEHVKSFLILSH